MPKITELTELASSAVSAANDVLAIVDGSAGETKKITVQSLLSSRAAIYTGAGSPEGVTTAVVGSIYYDITTPAAPIQYIKTNGTGNTGWV